MPKALSRADKPWWATGVALPPAPNHTKSEFISRSEKFSTSPQQTELLGVGYGISACRDSVLDPWTAGFKLPALRFIFQHLATPLTSTLSFLLSSKLLFETPVEARRSRKVWQKEYRLWRLPKLHLDLFQYWFFLPVTMNRKLNSSESQFPCLYKQGGNETYLVGLLR